MNAPAPAELDAIVVGGGFSGIQMLHELGRLGLSARLFEAGDDVGGTWYWNCYPGARCDVESVVYCYSFSRELLQEWDWKERYASQADALRYLQFAVERLNLRDKIQCSTRVSSARYDDEKWQVTTDDGSRYQCRFVVLATGLLSQPVEPPFDGVESFAGKTYRASRWPKEHVDLTGKRIGIIGTGSSGVQMTTELSDVVDELLVFQRTPNYVIPSGNRTLSDQDRADIKSRYDDIWKLAKEHPIGLALERKNLKLKDLPPAEREELLNAGWEAGGALLTNPFPDVAIDLESNEIFSEFIRNKIRAIVKDQAIAELLCPKDYAYGAKRPPRGDGYYQSFNRDNVKLVDVAADPIERITPRGVRTRSREYDLDVLIYATGFDAFTGSADAIEIQGRSGVRLRDKWASGAGTYLGVCVDDFPNLFLIMGPQAPFGNVPVVIDMTVNWIGQALAYMSEHGCTSFEASPDAVKGWCSEAQDLLSRSPVLPQGVQQRSWWLGANVDNKPHVPLIYFSGVDTYAARLQGIADGGFEGLCHGIADW